MMLPDFIHTMVAQTFISLNNYSNTPLESILTTQGPSDLVAFVNGAFRVAIIAGSTLAVLQIVRAGFMYVTSNVISSKDKAKSLIQDSLLGLLVLLATWIILNTINPEILNFKGFLYPVDASGTGSATVVGTPSSANYAQSGYTDSTGAARETPFIDNPAGDQFFGQ